MSYFESLIQEHLNGRSLRYLWEIKVSDAEYNELKQTIIRQAHSLSRNCNRFMSICKECVLFVAEFWRREYVEGAHSKEMVFNAIDSSISNNEVISDFFEAAKRGAKILKLEIFKGGKTEFLNSMLYQGGLPMKLVTGNGFNLWDRFTRGLVNRKINFDELNLGIVASNSQCLKDYCNQLILGIESEQYMLMPFYCENDNDPWFLYLKELAKEERSRSRQLHPFTLEWEFRIDTIEKKISTKYVLKGLQRLPESFVEEQKLQNTNFFSVQVRKNDQAVDTFDYVNNFCRYPVVSKHPYNSDGDYISLYIHNNDNPYIKAELDMRIPHLLYQNKDGRYVLGNNLGRVQSFLLVPENWEVGNASNFDIYNYTWGNIDIKGIEIPADYTNDIVIKGVDGSITFGINASLYWTELLSHPLYHPEIIEPLYNAQKSNYALCSDVNNGTKTKCNAIQYGNKWQDAWSDTPSYGEIFARATDPSGNYVSPMRFINIGGGLKIDLCSADNDSCQIKVLWPHGKVSTTEGVKKANDIWEIQKGNCTDPRRIDFLFVPDTNSKNQFHLSVKAPFKAFSIIDIYGNNISNNSVVPYSDLDKYQYHLVGQNIKEYTYANTVRSLCWKDDTLYITDKVQNTYKRIPYEGSLLTLFGTREDLRLLLDRTSKNIIEAKIDVNFVLSNGQTLHFEIQESPYRPNQTKDDRIEICDCNNNPIKFTGVLKLLKLDEPEKDPAEVSFNANEGCYVLPDKIKDWGKTILIGRTRGRIRPALIDTTRNMSGESRISNRGIAIVAIKEELAQSTLDDALWQRIIGWFYRTQKEDIPASSILELYCTAQDHNALLYLTFLLFAKCSNNDDRDILKEKLMSFSNDLAFQWYWLQPYLQGVMQQLQNFIGDPTKPSMKDIYIKWAMNQDGNEVMNYLSALNNEENYIQNIVLCLAQVINSYVEWMNELCISSLLERYNSSPDEITLSWAENIIKNPKKILRIDSKKDIFVDFNQDYLGEVVSLFFNQFNQKGKYGNELWLYKRVNAVASHLKKGIDLFSQQDEIRRSIIYCCKSCNEQFIIALNNKLAK